VNSFDRGRLGESSSKGLDREINKKHIAISIPAAVACLFIVPSKKKGVEMKRFAGIGGVFTCHRV
jgi:hypothetical protein